MEIKNISHIAFADEANHSHGRYRSIALVSLQKENYEDINKGLIDLLTESNIKEFKWSDLRSAKVRFAACKMLKLVITKVKEGRLRVDVLVWDTEDSRHRIAGRNDTKNLERMYHHLFKNVLLHRWPTRGYWHLFPDEHTGIKWNLVHSFLEKKNDQLKMIESMFAASGFTFELRTFGIHNITPAKSHHEPFIQVADLLAGLSVYSRQEYDTYEQWLEHSDPQIDFLRTNVKKFNSKDADRCHVLKEFNHKCKESKLGVSLKSNRGLHTASPKNPINFWLYEPQHENDKAPINEKAVTG